MIGEKDHRRWTGNKGIIARLLRPAITLSFIPLMASIGLSACSSGFVQSRGGVVAASGTGYNSAVYSKQTGPAYTASSGERMIDTADRLFGEGQITAAIPLYRTALSSHPARARLGLAKALVAQGRPEGAYDLTRVCVNQCPADLMIVRGEAALALGLYGEARGSFKSAMIDAPSAKGLAGLGISQALTGRYAAAIATFEKLPSPTGLSNKALVLIAMGRADEGRQIVEKMVRDGTAGLKERQNLTLAYVLLGDDARARTFAQLDLDLQSARQTLAFYRQLAALTVDARLEALVTGSIDPRWTRRDAGNFTPKPQETAATASERLLASAATDTRMVDAVVVSSAPESVPESVPEQAPAPAATRPQTLPAGAPPLLESTGWAVQIAAYRKIQALMTGWDILRASNLDILETIPPRRSEVDFGTEPPFEGGPTGFYYRLNAGPLETLIEAQTLCKTLILRGTDCWVRPPEVSEGRVPVSD